MLLINYFGEKNTKRCDNMAARRTVFKLLLMAPSFESSSSSPLQFPIISRGQIFLKQQCGEDCPHAANCVLTYSDCALFWSSSDIALFERTSLNRHYRLRLGSDKDRYLQNNSDPVIPLDTMISLDKRAH